MNRIDNDYCYNYGDYTVIHRRSTNYGRYNSYSDAKKVSDKLKENNWDKSKLKDIQKECGVKPRTLYNKGTSGYFGVYKQKNKNYRQGFTWVYQYRDEITGKNVHLSSVNLEDLEWKVKSKGLRWEKY